MKLVTIWWGNGQSNLLSGFFEFLPNEVELASIVSMSDDGRTTWELMRKFAEHLWQHLPPPGDLRKCLYSTSGSYYREYFMKAFETIFTIEKNISDFTILELYREISKEVLKDNYLPRAILDDVEFFTAKNKWPLAEYIARKNKNVLDYKLPLDSPIKWHKFWNILMASIYHNLWDYNEMLYGMHKLLEVKWRILPVTINRALIKAKLENGKVIETQDRISNVADYNSAISDLELMDCSKSASYNEALKEAILTADFIMIWPWDLYTSIISNLIIWWVWEILKKSNAEIIYVLNSTNKWGETDWYNVSDFVNRLEQFLWKNIDYLIANNKKLNLTWSELERFKNDISVKWWDYLYITDEEIEDFEKRWIKVVERDFLDKVSLYKHNKKKISKATNDILRWSV